MHTIFEAMEKAIRNMTGDRRKPPAASVNILAYAMGPHAATR